VEIALAATERVDTLPADALALFGSDAYSTEGWYRSTAAAALPAGTKPCFLVATRAQQCLAVIPMSDGPAGFGSLTTPYTCLWHPLLPPDAGAPALQALGAAFGGFCRRHAVTRLEAVDADAPWVQPFMAGVRRAGLLPLWFAHFGNWCVATPGLDWSGYLAARPGKLRETIRRRTRRLMAEAAFSVTGGTQGLDDALEAYAQVYAKSWKQPEPFAQFNPALMRACARDGTLRLGILRHSGEPVAAQFWILHGRWAGLQKLAHVEAKKELAPGTVLTGLMIRHLLDEAHATELDFGRGDDAYKQDWTGTRRQRHGVLLANPSTARGLGSIARHYAGVLRRRPGGAVRALMTRP
jgi:hypothetical protein